MDFKDKFKLVSWTWGLPLTLLGYLVAVVLKAMGYEPREWGGATYFVVGEGWGGVSFGPVIVICSDYDTDYVKNHEFGHSIQNYYFGPFAPLLVNIPSFLRAAYRELLVMSGNKEYSELPDYEDIWFESQATELGYEYIKYWER